MNTIKLVLSNFEGIEAQRGLKHKEDCIKGHFTLSKEIQIIISCQENVHADHLSFLIEVSESG